MSTEAMKEREQFGATWKDEGGGYFSTSFQGPFALLSYVAVPENHPDVGKDYDTLYPEVNGGLTFGDGNVFGWDYGHYQNHNDIEGDIARALEFFRDREKVGAS